MAKNINIDPSISLEAKPPTTMTLPQMLDMARGIQSYQQAQQVFPEQAEQARIATQTARTGQEQATFNLSKDQNAQLMNIIGGYRNDPRISSGNADAALSALDEIKVKAANLGIPRSVVERMAGTATNIAINNPKAMAQYFDNAIQTSAGASAQLGLQTPELTTSAGAPALFRRGPGTLAPVPMEGAPAQPPAAMPTEAPRGVTPADMTAPIAPAPQAAPMAAPAQAVDPGFEVRFPVRRAGDIRPFAPGEQEAQVAGTTYLNNMMTAQGEVPKAIRNVSEVIKGAEELAKTINFDVGKPAEIEQAVRKFFGEEQYQQLSKDIANAQIALMRSTGGDLTTDAGKALVARATGDETYSPQVLISIARRLNGELTKVDMEAKGAQKAATLFGNANLPAFQQAWNENADLRVFEAISIVKNIKDPQKQKSALDKILPNNADELMDFQNKYRNIKKLTETGTLR